MKVLVTGHDGYIGSILSPWLSSAGHDVVNLDTFYFEDCALEDRPEHNRTLRKDIRDVEEQDLRGFEAVVHLAALSNDPLGDLNPDLTHEINHSASVRLAKMSREAGVKRFLYSSSCSIYGASGDDLVTEDAPLRPLTAYGVSKARTEEDISKLADGSFSPVFMRNATAYGVSPKLRADVVLNNLVCWAYTTGQVRVLSDGMAWRPLVHTEDIAQAFEIALTVPRDAIHNQAFNVGATSENLRVRRLAEIVEETVPGCKVTYAEGMGADRRSYRVDFGKLTKWLPTFKPKWDARLGARQLYSTFERKGLSLEDFQGRRYVRLEQLKYLMNAGRLDATLRWNN